jgi:hypothetical protein
VLYRYTLESMCTHDAIILTHVMVFILVARASYRFKGGCFRNMHVRVDR